MDIEKIFNEGGYIIPNPNYDKKKKKNTEPPTILSPDVSKYGSSMAGRVYGSTSDMWLMGDTKKYQDYGIEPRPGIDLDKELADKQSGWAKMFNALGQTVVSEIGLGTVKGFTDLLGFVGQKLGLVDSNYNNILSEGVAKAQDWFNEDVMPIYTDPSLNISNGGFGDVGWWAKNIPSIASSLTLLFPARGITAGFGKLGKALKVGEGTSKARRWLSTLGKAKTAKEIESIDDLSRVARFINNPEVLETTNAIGKIGTEALLMRTMENYQEAGDAHKQTYDNAILKFSKMNDDEYQQWLDNNKSWVTGIDTTDKEQVAKLVAKKAADRTFGMDFANIIFDMVQLWGLGELGKNVPKITKGKVKSVQRESIEDLKTLSKKEVTEAAAANTAEAAKAAGKKPSIIGKFFKGVKNTAKDYGLIALEESTEGIEEAVNYVAQQEGITYGKMLLEGDNSRENGFWSSAANVWLHPYSTFKDYMHSPEMWESAFWGVVGGVVFNAGGSALNRQQLKAKQKAKRKELKELGYNIPDEEDNDFINLMDAPIVKAAKIAIGGRIQKWQSLLSDLELINSGHDIYGKPNADQTYRKFEGSNEEVELKKAKAKAERIREFRYDLAANAIASGTFDLLVDYFNSEPMRQAMIDLGLANESNVDGYINETIQDLNEVKDIYYKQATLARNMATIINTSGKFDVNIPTQYINMIAKQNTDLLINSRHIDRQLSDLDKEIAEEEQAIIDSLPTEEEKQEKRLEMDKAKSNTRVQMLMDIYSRLEADKNYIQEHVESSLERKLAIDQIESQQRGIITQLRRSDAGRASILSAIKLAQFYEKEITTSSTGEETVKYKAKSNRDFYAKTDEEIIKEYESLITNSDKKLTEDEINDLSLASAKLDSDLGVNFRKDSLINQQPTLGGKYAERTLLQYKQFNALAQVATTKDQYLDKLDTIHTRLNEARLNAIKAADSTFRELFNKYKEKDLEGVEEALYEAANNNNPEESRKILEKFMSSEDVERFMSALDIFKFSHATNVGIARDIQSYIELQKEVDRKRAAAENTPADSAETVGENQSSSAPQNSSQSTQNQQTDNSTQQPTQSNTNGNGGQNQQTGTNNQQQPISVQEALDNIGSTEDNTETNTNGNEPITVQVSSELNADSDIISTKEHTRDSAGVPFTLTSTDGRVFTMAEMPTHMQSVLGYYADTNMFNVINPNNLDYLNSDVDFALVSSPEFTKDNNGNYVLTKKGQIEVKRKGEQASTTVDGEPSNPPVEDNQPAEVPTTDTTPTDSTATPEPTIIDNPGNRDLDITRNGFKSPSNPKVKYNYEAESVTAGGIPFGKGTFIDNDGTITNIEALHTAILDCKKSDGRFPTIFAYLKHLREGQRRDAVGTANMLYYIKNKILREFRYDNFEDALYEAFPELKAVDESFKKEEEERLERFRLDTATHKRLIQEAMAAVLDNMYNNGLIDRNDVFASNLDLIQFYNDINDYLLHTVGSSEEVELMKTTINEEVSKIETLREKYAALSELNQAGASFAMAASLLDPSTVNFSVAFKNSAEAFLEEYKKLVTLPEVDGRQVVKLVDILQLCNNAFGTSVDNIVAQSMYNLVKNYLLTDPFAKRKYLVLDIDDVNKNNVVNNINASSQQRHASHQQTAPIRAIMKEVWDYVSDPEFGDENRAKFEEAYNSLQEGDVLEIVSLEGTIFAETEDKRDNGNSDVLISKRVGLAKNGQIIAFYPKTAYTPFGQPYYVTKGWVARFDENGKSPLKDLFIRLLTSNDAAAKDFRDILYYYSCAKTSGLFDTDKTIRTNVWTKFLNNQIIKDLIDAARDKSNYGNLIYSVDGNPKISIDLLDHLDELLKYANDINITTDPAANKQQVIENIDSWFATIYEELIAGEAMTQGASATVDMITGGVVVNNKEASSIGDVTYNDCLPVSEALAAGTIATVSFAEAANKIIVAGRGVMSYSENGYAPYSSFLTVYNDVGTPTHVALFPLLTSDPIAGQNTLLNELGVCALNGLSKALATRDMTEIEKTIKNFVAVSNGAYTNGYNPTSLLRSKPGSTFSFKRLRDGSLTLIYKNRSTGEQYEFIVHPKSQQWDAIGYSVTSFMIDPLTGTKVKKKIDGGFVGSGVSLTTITTAFSNFIADKTMLNLDYNAIRRDNIPGSTQLSGWINRINGKVVLNFPGRQSSEVYDNYSDFIIKNNLVRVNLKKSENGTNFEKFSKDSTPLNNIYLSLHRTSSTNTQDNSNVTSSSIPTNDYVHVEDDSPETIERMNNIRRILETNQNNPILDIIKETFDSTEQTVFNDVLSRYPELNDIFPSAIDYDNLLNGYRKIRVRNKNTGKIEERWVWKGKLAFARGVGNGRYRREYTEELANQAVAKRPVVKQGHVVVGAWWLNAIASKIKGVRNAAIQTLVHEKVHDKYTELDEKTRNRLIKELKTIYDEAEAWVKERIAKQDFESFGLTASEIKYFVDAFKDYRSGQRLAEELLAESLTAKAVFNILNAIEVTDAKDNKKQTVFDKILNFIRELFGWNQVKEDTLMQKELNAIRDALDSDTNIETENITEEEEVVEATEETPTQSQNVTEDDEYDEYDEEDYSDEDDEGLSATVLPINYEIASRNKTNIPDSNGFVGVSSVTNASKNLPLKGRVNYQQAVEEGIYEIKC